MGCFVVARRTGVIREGWKISTDHGPARAQQVMGREWNQLGGGS